MEPITQYQAKDGRVFKTEEKCLKYEGLCNNISEIMATLPSKPEDDNCSFSNGKGFIQHEEQSFLHARKRLLLLAMQYSDHPSLQKAIDVGILEGPSFADRIIDDGCPQVLYYAWSRIMNTTQDFREFGQCYYRLNPHKAELIQLNI